MLCLLAPSLVCWGSSRFTESPGLAQELLSFQCKRGTELLAWGAVLRKDLNVMALNVTQQGCVSVCRSHGDREKQKEIVTF